MKYVNMLSKPVITMDHLLTFANKHKSSNTYSLPNSIGNYVHFPKETLHLDLVKLLQDFFSENCSTLNIISTETFSKIAKENQQIILKKSKGSIPHY